MTDVTTSRSFSAINDAGSSPSGAGVDGGRLSTTRSASAARARTRARPSAVATSRPTLRLFAQKCRKETALLGVRDVAGEGARPPQGMPARGFHEEHLGAEVGQQAGAVRPGDAVAEVENANAGKGFFRHGLLSLGKP